MSHRTCRLFVFLCLMLSVMTAGAASLAGVLFAADPAPKEARAFKSTFPLSVWMQTEGERPKVLGFTGPGAAKAVTIPAGADWWVQPVSFGFGGGMPAAGGLQMGVQAGGAAGFVGGQFGVAGGMIGGGNPPKGGKGKAPPKGGGAVGAGPGVFGTEMTGPPLTALVAELKKHRVPGLAVRGMSISAADLGKIVALPTLTSLRVGPGKSIDEAGLAVIGASKTLKQLSLESVPLTAKSFESLSRLKTLTRLDLAGDGVTDEHMDAVKDLAGLTNVRLLYTRVSGAGIGKLKSMPALTSLTLAGPYPDEHLRPLVTLSKLKRLRLHQTAMTDATLDRLKGMDTLEELTLDAHFGPDGRGTWFNPVTGQPLAGANLPTQVVIDAGKAVNIPEAKWTAKGVHALKALPNLGELDVWHAGFADADAGFLEGFAGLRRLSLFAPNMTDASRPSLKSLAKLRDLDVSGTATTSALAATLRNLKALKSVRTNVSPVDRAKLAEWRKLLPGVTIKPIIDSPAGAVGGAGGFGGFGNVGGRP